MRLAIKVRGEMVRQGLENIHQEIPAVGRRRMRTVMNRVVRRMQEYPLPRPGQRYKRTGRFGGYQESGGGWQIKELSRTGHSTGYTLENRAERKGRRYGQYVVGDAYGTSQAWMHKGRWPRFRDVTEEELERLPKEVLDEIMIVARREEFEVT